MPSKLPGQSFLGTDASFSITMFMIVRRSTLSSSNINWAIRRLRRMYDRSRVVTDSLGGGHLAVLEVIWRRRSSGNGRRRQAARLGSGALHAWRRNRRAGHPSSFCSATRHSPNTYQAGSVMATVKAIRIRPSSIASLAPDDRLAALQRSPFP